MINVNCMPINLYIFYILYEQPRILINLCIYRLYTQELLYFVQCKHSHEYNDLLFHLFTDRVMKEGCGACPEANMHQALVLFMRDNINKVTEISQNFLKRKGISVDEYIEYILSLGTGAMSLH